jgi:hypothetical protein
MINNDKSLSPNLPSKFASGEYKLNLNTLNQGTPIGG